METETPAEKLTESQALKLLTAIQILTESEAAKVLFAKPQTLTKWRCRGRGPAYLKISGKIRYKMDDLEKFIEESRVVPRAAKHKRSMKRSK